MVKGLTELDMEAVQQLMHLSCREEDAEEEFGIGNNKRKKIIEERPQKRQRIRSMAYIYMVTRPIISCNTRDKRKRCGEE